MDIVKKIILLGVLAFFIMAPTSQASDSVNAGISKDTRCAVCGMFVVKYPTWICKIVLQNGKIEYFDGVKDMMAYYFTPGKYGDSSKKDIKEIEVQDYYSLKWFNAKQGYFVMGSDVYGPMGNELIPFSSNEAAESFAKDHKAKSVLGFHEITPSMVQALRQGQMMKMK